MEVAYVEQTEPDFVASGTQLGATYELRYRLTRGVLRLELVGERTLERSRLLRSRLVAAIQLAASDP
jgi:hypothetical protein